MPLSPAEARSHGTSQRSSSCPMTAFASPDTTRWGCPDGGSTTFEAMTPCTLRPL